MPFPFRPILSAWFLLPVVGLAACAGKAAKDPALATDPAGATETQPAPFSPTAPPPSAPEIENRSPYASSRGAIFDAAWNTVAQKHYDKALGGVDWNAAREKYRNLALGAPDEPTFYRVMNDLLGELRQSHLFITGPGDENPLHSLEKDDNVSTGGDPGNPGIVIRDIEGKPTITRVRPGSSGALAGMRPGFIVTNLGGRPLTAHLPRRTLRPIEQRFYLRRTADRLLQGPAGSRITIRYIDNADRPGEVALTRDTPTSQVVRFGNLPALYPEFRVEQAGDIGIIAFDFFMMGDLLDQITAAIDKHRVAKTPGLILDLRGNPGGMAAMAISIASRLVDKKISLGTMQFRDHENHFVATTSLDVKPYLGKVVILTDEGSASTSEILAAGLQEAKRATVVGGMTLGAALPSAIEQLPGGAILQYVIADFRTPAGVLLEGRGVQPDRLVVESRRALQEGHDAVLDTALDIIRARKESNRK